MTLLLKETIRLRALLNSIWLVALMAVMAMPAGAQQDDEILEYLPAIMSGVKKLPRKIDFEVELPTILSSDEYVISGVPNNRDGDPVANTDKMQAEIDKARDQGFHKVRLPAGHYLIGKFGNAIYQRGIELHGDTEFIMEGATLEMGTNDKWNYCVIALTRDSNVIIRGGTLIGDRATHIFTPRVSDGKTAHDEGHGICIQSNSKKILVENMVIKNLTGDGLLLVNEIEDVTIRNNNIFNNRRQGVSMVGTTRTKIENNEIHHIEGTSPQFGIDVEGAGRKDKDILIRKNYFHHNRGGDIVTSSGRNTFIIDNRMEQGEGNRYIDGPLVTWERTDNVIARNTITMLSGSVNGRLGYIQYSGGRDNNPQTTYVHDNVCNGCGMYMYKANNADIRRNKFLGYFLALADFQNATVIDNVVTTGPPGTPQYCWTYRIRNTTGTASGNTFNGRDANLPLSNTPWTSKCLRR